jgi:hypothetical protein
MDADLKRLLAELPSKPPRSRLEPYREFIEELRSRGRTYRDIAEILAEKCRVQVTASGIHDFVRTRSRREKSQVIKTAKSMRLSLTRPAENTLPKAPSSDEVQRKIAELKARHSTTESVAKEFEYDADEPLRLRKPNSK